MVHGAGTDNRIPKIDLEHFGARPADVIEELWAAATGTGIFQLVNHGISQQQIDEAFALSQAFFALPKQAKAHSSLVPGANAGWEYKAQIRPSTGTADQKESFQITLPHMADLWPASDALPTFQDSMQEFERVNWELAMTVLACLAPKLGFAVDHFTTCHNPQSPDYQCTLRLLHYLAMENAKPDDFKYWRAGAHTDFGCLTLLHQKTGQRGLQARIEPLQAEPEWVDIEPQTGVILCNIGDMLRRWSDDKLQSAPHRVRMPRGD